MRNNRFLSVAEVVQKSGCWSVCSTGEGCRFSLCLCVIGTTQLLERRCSTTEVGPIDSSSTEADMFATSRLLLKTGL